jgi:hypothetical protein
MRETHMAKRGINLKDQSRGTIAALQSKKTPPQLREGLRRRKADLEKQLRDRKPGNNQNRSARNLWGLL